MKPRVGKKLTISDCPNLYQCLHLHGGGPDDLQLHLHRQNHEDQGVAIRLVLCLAGDPVRLPHRSDTVLDRADRSTAHC